MIHSVASHTPGLLPALQAFVQDPAKPVYGTCAGMILLSAKDGIGGGKIIKGRPPAEGWDGIPSLRVWRNLYGRESSLLTALTFHLLDTYGFLDR